MVVAWRRSPPQGRSRPFSATGGIRPVLEHGLGENAALLISRRPARRLWRRAGRREMEAASATWLTHAQAWAEYRLRRRRTMNGPGGLRQMCVTTRVKPWTGLQKRTLKPRRATELPTFSGAPSAWRPCSPGISSLAVNHRRSAAGALADRSVPGPDLPSFPGATWPFGETRQKRPASPSSFVIPSTFDFRHSSFPPYSAFSFFPTSPPLTASFLLTLAG